MRFLWLAVLFMALAGSVAGADTRGISVQVKDTGGATVALYAESHALIVGVSEYTNGWPRLRGVGEDVPAVKAALERQGFAVTVVMDPDRRQLDDAFRSFISRHGQRPDNRLLFYFAGHGHSMKLGYGGMMGYLVGHDAPNPNVDKVGFKNRALSMQVIETYARNIESKHALFLFDACFAGSVFDATRAIPEVIRAKTGRPVRQFITSGTAEQQVPDRSVFRRQFVAALGGEGDLDGDGYVTGAELGQFLETTVTNYTRRSQTPQYGKLRDPLLDKGDFVFALPEGGGLSVSGSTGGASSGGMTAEMMFWQSIQNSTDAADYEAYLSQYPNGSFAALARARVAKHKAPQVAALPPAPSFRVTPVDEEMVVAKTANVRAEPSTISSKIGRLSAGTKVDVTGRATVSGSTWYRIALAGNQTGYVFGTLLTEIAAVVPPPPPPTSSPVQPAVGAYPRKPGDTFKDCSDCPEMIAIPAGSFTMGSPESETSREGVPEKYASRERPQHQVRIPRPFALGKYEVTRAQFSVFVGATGHQTGNSCWVDTGGGNWKDTSGKGWRDPGFRQTENDPVVCVSWKDATAYVEWLSRKTGKNYRLPSEGEWEYAARSHTTTARYWGDDADSGCGYANVHDRTSKKVNGFSWTHHDCDDRYGQTAPVGQFRANGFGLHDMLGNAFEWTADCWHENYDGAPTDGSAWTSGGECGRRVLRGGSWVIVPGVVRSAYRDWSLADDRYYVSGFRVARTY